jgi:hypothetical protein
MLQHTSVDVGQHHEACVADLAREPRGQIAGAARDIERPPPRPEAGQRQRKLLPQSVRAARHQIVHQIVAIGHRVEHAAHASRFVLERNLLKAKINTVAAFVSHMRAIILLCCLYSARVLLDPIQY